MSDLTVNHDCMKAGGTIVFPKYLPMPGAVTNLGRVNAVLEDEQTEFPVGYVKHSDSCLIIDKCPLCGEMLR